MHVNAGSTVGDVIGLTELRIVDASKPIAATQSPLFLGRLAMESQTRSTDYSNVSVSAFRAIKRLFLPKPLSQVLLRSNAMAMIWIIIPFFVFIILISYIAEVFISCWKLRNFPAASPGPEWFSWYRTSLRSVLQARTIVDSAYFKVILDGQGAFSRSLTQASSILRMAVLSHFQMC